MEGFTEKQNRAIDKLIELNAIKVTAQRNGSFEFTSNHLIMNSKSFAILFNECTCIFEGNTIKVINFK